MDEFDLDDELVEEMVDFDLAEEFEHEITENYNYNAPETGQSLYSLEDFKMFTEEESNIFFWQNYLCEEMGNGEFGGLRGIAYRSLHRRDIYGPESFARMTDTILLFSYMNSMLNMSLEQKHTFLRTTRLLRDVSPRLDVQVNLPSDMKEARAILLEGVYGMFRNIPHPTVNDDKAGHAYVSLKELLKQVCALKVPIEFTEGPGFQRKTNDIHGTEAMTDLLRALKQSAHGKNGVYFGYMIFWSDGFITSWIKQKDNSAWILTVTLPDPSGSRTSPYHTYCLAVGLSKYDHTDVIEFYMKEVQEIMEGMPVYFAEDNSVRTISLGILAYLADRPKRSAILKTTDKGIFAKRSLWSGIVDHKKLPYCDACFSREIADLKIDRYSESGIPSCGRCSQWNMNEKRTSLLQNSRVREHYPRRACPNGPDAPEGRSVSDLVLPPVKLTFAWLRLAVRYACHNVQVGQWKTKDNVKAYLQACSVQPNIQDEVYDNFHPKRRNDNSKDVDGILPYLWKSLLMITMFIECGMHHIFRGVVRDII